MPKRPRQAHVPQQPRRRRGRRSAADISEEQLYASPAAGIAPDLTGGVVATPRPSARARPAVSATSVRAVATLPVYDRSFIVSEVKRIAVLSGSLLALVVVLAVLLR